MRVLFSCRPVLGSLFAMVPLARAAGRAGHEVVVASGADLAGVIEREGFTHWSMGPSHGEFAARYRGAGDAGTGSLASDLVPEAMEWKPDLVVHGPADPAGAIAAAYTGARHAVHGFGLCPPGSWSGPAQAELFDRWQVPELADELLDVTYLDAVPPSLQPNGPAGFRRVQPIRPAGPAAPTRTPPELDGLPPGDLVYLTLGTLANHELEVFRTALLGLATLPVNVIVTAGPGRDPGRLGPQPPNVRVTDYLPQEHLLPHCRLVVSHGGAGTATGALAHGLPQLVLPRAADQFRTAAAIQAAGAGLSLPAEVLTPDAVADDAARLLNQPRFTETAQRIRTEFDTMPSADQVLAGLLHDAAVN